MHNFKMDWEFPAAENGNIALTAEVDLPDTGEFEIGVALGSELPECGHQVVPVNGRAV